MLLTNRDWLADSVTPTVCNGCMYVQLGMPRMGYHGDGNTGFGKKNTQSCGRVGGWGEYH